MRFAAAILVVTVSAFLISFVPVVHAADEYGLDTVAGSAELKGLGGDVPEITGRFLGAALSLVGILFFILTIYGGVLWMTSHGNSEQATNGLKTTIAAIIGLVIVLAAYTITSFVFRTVEGGEQAARSTPSAGLAQERGLICCVYRLGLTTDRAEIMASEVACIDSCLNSRARTDCRVNYVTNRNEC